MISDPVLNNAIGAFAFHSYATAGNTGDLKAALAKYTTKNIWMTEYSGNMGVRGELRPNSGDVQLDNAIGYFQRMGGDIVDFGAHYWFFWRGWHSASQLYDQDLVASDQNGVIVDQPYFAFKRLWTTVKPGWNLMRSITTDTELRTDNDLVIYNHSGDEWSAPVNIVGFKDSTSQKSFLSITNSYATDKVLQTVSGLVGNRAKVYRFDLSHHGEMILDTTLANGILQGGSFPVPAYSITMISTSTDQAPVILKNSGKTNAEVAFKSKLQVDLQHNSVFAIGSDGRKFSVLGARGKQ